MKKNLIVLGCTLLTIILFLELFLGNIYYRHHNPGKFSLIAYAVDRRVMPLINDQKLFDPKKMDMESNPFIKIKSPFSIKFHPFIDYTIAYSTFGKEARLDYFGFRNDTDLYFEKNRDYNLVIFTGGSEAAGYSHSKTISENIEDILNQNSKKKFKVLNLAMNSYTLSNEINAYVNLAYQLKPEFVITHSGSNDASTSLVTPYKFKELGLFYAKVMERHWLPRLYLNRKTSIYIPQLEGEGVFYDFRLERETLEDEFVVYKKGLDIVADRYHANLKKYEAIVNSNGGNFIVGIQPINLSLEREHSYWLSAPNKTEVLDAFEKIYNQILEKAEREGYLSFKHVNDFVDFVHSTDESSVKIAQVYAQAILEKMANEKELGKLPK